METYLPIIIAAVLYLIRIREFLIRRDTVPGPIKEKLSFILMFAGGTLVTFGAMAEYLFMNGSATTPQVVVGALITLTAFAYRNWAIHTLGKFWSIHVEIRENHELIDRGPFKTTRHPVYTAAILEAIGITIILQSIFSLFIIILIILPSIFYRIRLEEKELIRKFGRKYQDYMKRSWPLIPKIF